MKRSIKQPSRICQIREVVRKYAPEKFSLYISKKWTIEKEKTILDLIVDLRIPVILVVGNYLGSVSHTLSVVKNIQFSKLNIINIIINQNNDCDLDIDDTKKLIDTSLINKIITRKIYKESNYESKEIQLITKDILNYFQC